MIRRLPSTPEQIDQVIAARGCHDPCWWLGLIRLCTPEEAEAIRQASDRWPQVVPAHRLLAALLAERSAHLDGAMARSQAEGRLRAEVRDVRRAARVIAAAAARDLDDLAAPPTDPDSDPPETPPQPDEPQLFALPEAVS